MYCSQDAQFSNRLNRAKAKVNPVARSRTGRLQLLNLPSRCHCATHAPSNQDGHRNKAVNEGQAIPWLFKYTVQQLAAIVIISKILILDLAIRKNAKG